MRRAILPLLAIAISGCVRQPGAAAPPTSIPVRIATAGRGTNLSLNPDVKANVVTISQPIADAWKYLPAVYDSLQIPLTTKQDNDLYMGNEGIKLRRKLAGVSLTRYLDCGAAQGTQNAETYDIQLSVLTQLTPDPVGGTAVSSVVQASAHSALFGSSQAVNCSSTGQLELRIGKLLGAIIAKK
jgi:hypothetical protein